MLKYIYFQVCANGLVSFDKVFLQPKPARGHDLPQNENILAPFFASVDMESHNAGTIFYRTVDLLNNLANITSPAVQQLDRIMKYSPNVHKDFSASTVLVVTWDRVLPRQMTFSSTMVQTIFIFDGLLILNHRGITLCFVFYIFMLICKKT